MWIFPDLYNPNLKKKRDSLVGTVSPTINNFIGLLAFLRASLLIHRRPFLFF